jgi:hypothetical protein
MSVIGLELSDAGIMAANSTTGNLLKVDGQSHESPGFALPEKRDLLVGKVAESKAHLLPRQIINNFWDHLSTDPLEQPGAHVPQSTAEIAYNHLDFIWKHIQQYGNEVIIAVPGFYSRQELGLLLGIANELSIPVRGFMPLALATSPDSKPGKMILYLDVHLHRLEVTYLMQGTQLTLADSVTGTEKGLIYLYKQWAEAIGQEFVDNTRFDPLHQAASEQKLYHRLPGILFNLQHSPSISFDMTGGSRSYGITLSRDLIVRKAEPVYVEIRQLIEGLRSQHGENETPVVLQLTHRLARLPGCKEFFTGIKDAEIFELEKGAGARGCLEIWRRLSDQSDDGKISFFSSRPFPRVRSPHDRAQAVDDYINVYPTHLLFRSIAYRISENPLYFGDDLESKNPGVRAGKTSDEISSVYFSVQLREREVVLKNLNTNGTYVNETLISGSTVLQLGQTLRVGASGETLQLIACIDNHEA